MDPRGEKRKMEKGPYIWALEALWALYMGRTVYVAVHPRIDEEATD